MKEYSVFFEQVNAQCITVQASSPAAAAKKASKVVRDYHPELSVVEWVDKKTNEYKSARPSELGL